MLESRSNSARGQWAQGSSGPRGLAGELRAALGDPVSESVEFLERVFALAPDQWLRRMPGRETFVHGGNIVIKRCRGDQWSEWWHERLRQRSARSPARRESENLSALRESGLRVPTPLAWAEDIGARAAAPFQRGRSAMAMERVAHREHLRQTLSRSAPEEVRAWIAPLARMVAQLHGVHWFHRDLYLQHFAVCSVHARELALLDCGRARRMEPVPLRWIVKDLAQLLHSCPSTVGRSSQLRWLIHYTRLRRAGVSGGADVARTERRALVELVIAKQRRMAAHAPRHIDPRTANPDGSER